MLFLFISMIFTDYKICVDWHQTKIIITKMKKGSESDARYNQTVKCILFIISLYAMISNTMTFRIHVWSIHFVKWFYYLFIAWNRCIVNKSITFVLTSFWVGSWQWTSIVFIYKPYTHIRNNKIRNNKMESFNSSIKLVFYLFLLKNILL